MKQLEKCPPRVKKTLDKLIYTDFVPIELKKEEINYDPTFIRLLPLVSAGTFFYAQSLTQHSFSSLILPAYFFFESVYPIFHDGIHHIMHSEDKKDLPCINRLPALSFIELGYYFSKKLFRK